MKIACFADDPREPELIGEAEVDLTEVLTKGETDGQFRPQCFEYSTDVLCDIDWFTLSNKDKFAGKVYMELTFWSNVSTLSSIIHSFYHLIDSSVKNKGAAAGEKNLPQTT